MDGRAEAEREALVSRQIEGRGVRDRLVLAAMRAVQRELFVPEEVAADAYDDTPLPIGCGQTISQPYIVAFMVEALQLRGGEKVLEIGAGSGYAAAVLAQIAGKVFTIERIGELAARAAANLAAAGCGNVHVRHADGTQGWIDEAPFDAILVSAGAPDVPKALMRQLAVGGRMVIPVGRDQRAQELVRVRRVSEDEFDREDIADVRFVPLIGAEGWDGSEHDVQTKPPRVVQKRPVVSLSIPEMIAAAGEPFDGVEDANLDALVERIGDAKVVLIGEATHGTSEFYRLRARLSQALIETKGFDIVAIEGDWPDAARIDHYVRHREAAPAEWAAFARFPTWMWRNAETRDFVDWLHERNAGLSGDRRVAFYGLDLYSLYTSAQAVIAYLDGVDGDLAALARERYGCLMPWESDPAAYGRAALRGSYKDCEQAVTHVLMDLLEKRQSLRQRDGDPLFDAEGNARLVAAAERYYRSMYYGSRASWNLRDRHMFETLRRVLEHRGGEAKAIVWAHNSHVGDATATEMGRRGETNIGQLCRRHFADDCRNVGFGTNDGTVAAASDWDAPMQVMSVRPAHAQSIERLFHLAGIPGLVLPLRQGSAGDLDRRLQTPRLERAIGVIYRPESELTSHYFEAVLPRQFDEYVWIDRTSAVTPLDVAQLQGMPDTYPFGL